MTLTEFLMARIDDDDERARFVWSQIGEYNKAHRFEQWRLSWHDEYDLLCIEPDRAIVECEAKRRIVDAHSIYRGERIQAIDTSGRDFGCALCHRLDALHADTLIEASGYCDTLLALALPYADHPDYDESWRP